MMPAHAAPAPPAPAPPAPAFRALAASATPATGPFLPARHHGDLDASARHLDASARSLDARDRSAVPPSVPPTSSPTSTPPSCRDAFRLFRRCAAGGEAEGFSCGGAVASYARCALRGGR